MRRAKKILAAFKGGVGAYTDSRGNPLVREEVAKFFEDRDGMKSDPDVSSAWQGFLHCTVIDMWSTGLGLFAQALT